MLRRVAASLRATARVAVRRPRVSALSRAAYRQCRSALSTSAGAGRDPARAPAADAAAAAMTETAPGTGAATASASASASTDGGKHDGRTGDDAGADSGEPKPLPRSAWVLLGLMGVSGGYALSLVLYFPEPCTLALKSAEEDERVAKALGLPLRPVWPWRWTGDAGMGHLTSHPGYAAFSIPFTSPRGRGEITARMALNPKTARWERIALVVSGFAAADGVAADGGSSSGEQQIYFEFPSDLPIARPPPGAPAATSASGVSPLNTRNPHAPLPAPAPAMADAWRDAHDAVMKAHGAAMHTAAAHATAPASNASAAAPPAPAASAANSQKPTATAAAGGAFR